LIKKSWSKTGQNMLKTDLEWNRTIICWEKTAYPNHLPSGGAGTDRIKNNLSHMQKSPLPPLCTQMM